MKNLFLVGTLVAGTLAQSNQTASFVNTSWTSPFTVGDSVILTWTSGNNNAINLTLQNSTWAYQIFANRSAAPTSYLWSVPGPPGLVSGRYQLLLQQTGASSSLSPEFNVVAPASTNTASMTTIMTTTTTMTTNMTTQMPAATVTFVFWDTGCGCTKTGSALMPLNTSVPLTTVTWSDALCGCHMSTVIPVSTLAPTSNYTVPALQPPLVTPSSTSAAAQTPAATASTTPVTYKGGATRLGGSISGMLMMVLAMVLA